MRLSWLTILDFDRQLGWVAHYRCNNLNLQLPADGQLYQI